MTRYLALTVLHGEILSQRTTKTIQFMREERRRGLKESEEVTAIKAFLAGKQKNMCFEYDDKKEAKRRYDSVRNFRLQHKLQEVFDMYRKDKCIYILRIKKKGTPGPTPRQKKNAAPDAANIKDGE